MNYYELKIDEYTIYVYSNSVKSILNEANPRGTKSIGGPYSVTKHPPHTRGGQYHFHVYNKNNELFSINVDGSAHDQSHGKVIPQKVADGLKKLFPKLKIPSNNLIESLNNPGKGVSIADLLIEIHLSEQMRNTSQE